MSSGRELITGPEATAMLTHAAVFMDTLAAAESGAFGLEIFEIMASPSRAEGMLAYLGIATNDPAYQEATHWTARPVPPDGELGMSFRYTPHGVESFSRPFGTILRALGDVAVDCPFPIIRAVGTACTNPISLTLEIVGEDSVKDNAEMHAFLEAGGWLHSSVRPRRNTVLHDVLTPSGERQAYVIMLDRLPER